MSTRRVLHASTIRKFGTAAFLFFLVKGRVWLAAGGALLASTG